MKTLALAAAALLIAAPAFAQVTYNTRPAIYGEPQYGSVTTDSNGNTYTTRPVIYGEPQYGSVTTAPNGSRCRTQPKLYGEPQYGSTTTCD